MWLVREMESNSDGKKSETVNFIREWTQLEYIVLIETTQDQRKIAQVLLFVSLVSKFLTQFLY